MYVNKHIHIYLMSVLSSPRAESGVVLSHRDSERDIYLSIYICWAVGFDDLG